MTILCIETSTSICSAAIVKDGVPAEECICREGSNHARLLPRYIQHLLQYAKEHQLIIEAVALSEGPGSYTGLRIGTATAKGLCYGLQIPLIPVSTLEVLREAARLQITDNQLSILLPMIDARRMEVYTLLNSEPKAVIVENEQSLVTDTEAVYCYFGDGAAKCQTVLTKPNWHYIPDIVPEARYVGRLAEQRIRENRQSMIDKQDLAYYEPFYLKEFIATPSHVKGLK